MKSGNKPAKNNDWAQIIEPVARALMGTDSNPRSTTRELRFGRKGSLSVVIEGDKAGQWFDHEAGKGGGVIDLVAHVLNVEQAGALDWLKRGGWIPPGTDTGDQTPATQPQPRRQPPTPAATPTPNSNTRHLVPSIIASTISADGTIGHQYLTKRLAWPPTGIGPRLPATLRWLPSDAVVPKWRGLPSGAMGALVFLWHRPREPDPCAVSLMAIMALDGCAVRVAWWNGQQSVTYGERRGAMFFARRREQHDEPLHLCEGEADALALAIAPWTGPSTVAAVGGTAGMKNAAASIVAAGSGPVVLHPDDDQAGRQAAVAASIKLRLHSIKHQIHWYEHGNDPAAELALWVLERAAICEYDKGMSRSDADRTAWASLLDQLEVPNDDR